MKKFMAVYTGSATPEQRAAMQADPARMQAGGVEIMECLPVPGA